MAAFQQKMQAGKITNQQEAQQAQATVQQMQSNLTRHQRQYEEAMTKATQAYQKELRKRINDYLAKYNKDGRYSLILTNSEATINILYATPGSDITKEVIEGLNKEYKKVTTTYFLWQIVGCIPQKHLLLHVIKNKEGWQSDRMRWTRNPVYPFRGIGGFESLTFRQRTLRHKARKLLI